MGGGLLILFIAIDGYNLTMTPVLLPFQNLVSDVSHRIYSLGLQIRKEPLLVVAWYKLLTIEDQFCSS